MAHTHNHKNSQRIYKDTKQKQKRQCWTHIRWINLMAVSVINLDVDFILSTSFQHPLPGWQYHKCWRKEKQNGLPLQNKPTIKTTKFSKSARPEC